MSDITRILQALEDGDPKAAEELLPLVYEGLRLLARQKMAREKPRQTLQATELVHEAYLRLVGPENQHWKSRKHFFGAAAEAMRRILVERARRKQRARHGGQLERVNVDEVEIETGARDDQLLAVDEALDELTRIDPIKAEVVKLRYFVGLTAPETADVLHASLSSVERYWSYAKAWLFDYIRRSR